MAKVSLRAYNQEIETMIDRGHLDEAIAHCRHILKTFPKHLETYRLLGKAYLEYKRYPEAADIFSRILVAVPNDFVANVGMSIIRDEENRLDDAVWHMERAFETQPSNSAIQGELQRLYGRREGVAPPRIRMTRGALAHMYVQGELYPQAISEIKSVLKEDPGRNDMQVLLARAYFRSGLKNDAADVASAVLRSNPYNLDANRVLVEILSVDHPESVQTYRQRVVELDPYAAQVTSSVFSSNEVPDAAVTLEHLDWNGQPVGMQTDWQATQAISLENEPRQGEQPDWLKNAFDEPAAPSVPAFDAAPPPAKTAEPVNDIPDFLREAGWGKSTGAFDESKSPFTDHEPASAEPPIEQGELPDWVRAMAPQQPAETPAEEEEELPDWINKIGTSALPVSTEAGDQPDWLRDLDQPASQPTEDQPDWLKQRDTPEQTAASTSEEQPDWLKGFSSEAEAAPSDASKGELDWLDQLSKAEGAEARTFEGSSDEFDFLNKPAEPFDTTLSAPPSDEAGAQPETASTAASADDFDFLNPLGSQSTARASSGDEFDFLKESTTESDQVAPSTSPEPAKAGPLGMSEEEQDDSFAWLESLAAKQGATEGLLTKPEERLEEEPGWVKQAKGMDASQPPAESEQAPIAPAASDLEEPVKAEQEQDDTFAWLESLAAKQGATEGLLTKPEERPEEEPEWIRQARTLHDQPQEAPSEQKPQEEPAIAEPSSHLEEPGTTREERDDAFAWLESLAAKQGASEGLLTTPEERPEEEPEWVKQAKNMGESPILTPIPEADSKDDTGAWLENLSEEITQRQAEYEGQVDQTTPGEEARAEETPAPQPAAEEPAAVDEVEEWLQNLEAETTAEQTSDVVSETPDWMKQEDEPRAEEAALASPVTEQPATAEDTAAWLQSLDEEKAEPEAKGFSADDTAIWLKSLDEPEQVAPQPEETAPAEDLPAWMQDIEQEEAPAEEASVSAASAEAAEASEWLGSVEEQPEAVTSEAPKVDTGSLPSWLRGLEEEETERSTFGAQEDLPAWLRDETGEAVAEPTEIEPTRATDWQPLGAAARQPEPEPEPVVLPSEAAEPEPAVASSEAEPVDVVAVIEEKIAASEPEPEKPASPPRRPQEPASRKDTGTLHDPVLGQARNELSRNNVSGALENYGRLIKKGRFLEEIIYDLRDASYRYPVDVSIWQSLGDAYMRANRLQDALDAYTKAEELLR